MTCRTEHADDRPPLPPVLPFGWNAGAAATVVPLSSDPPPNPWERGGERRRETPVDDDDDEQHRGCSEARRASL
eukprot:5988403-Alexandrium_andersonii.AAC.1